MHKVTEMLCMFCLRSVTTTSPVCEKDDTVKEYITISRCRHLMHMSCFVFAHPADPVTCRYPKCGKVIDCNQVDVIEANLTDRIIVENAEEKSNIVDELTTRLNLATCNIELTSRLKVAEDKIAELEANAKNYSELKAEAEKRASEAKAAQLEAKKHHYAAEDKIAQLEANAKCNAELLMKADKRANEAKTAELKAKKRYDAAKDKIAKLEANFKLKSQLLAKADKHISEAKAAELDAKKLYDAAKEKMAQLEGNVKHYSELVVDANKRATEAKEAEVKAKKRYDAAKDNEMAKLEANAKHFLELAAEAEKRTSKAKAAELDAKKRYELVLGKLSNQLIACTCIASDSSVLVLKDCNELLPPGPTSPIAPSSGSNNVLELDQNQLVDRVEKTDTFNVGTSPNEECLKMESIADFPNALADFTPMSPTDDSDTFLPFSESIEGSVPKGTTDTLMKSSLQHRVRDPRLRPSSKRNLLIEKPISEFMLSDNNINHSPQSTSSESSIADKAAGASRHSRSADAGYRRKMMAQKTAIIAREDRSPAAKRWKSASESSTRDYERYWQRFGVTPPTLNPFFSLNTFPIGYTVAGIQDTDKACKVAILAYDVLLLGDGHVLGIANYVLKDKPFKDQLFESLYRRDLSIVDLITTLDRFTILPAKIILSIGNWDATQSMQSSQFLAHFKTLLEIFKKCQVKVLYILPIIFYPGMGLNREFIAGCLNTDWGKTFGGQYELLSEMVSSVINVQLPDIDDKGPIYELDEYVSLVEAIRDRFIPVPMTLPTEDGEETKAP